MASQSQTQTDAPTVTEFIPADDAPVTRDDETEDTIRVLQATGDGGLERVTTETYDDTVINHVFVCDECGESFPTEAAAGHHLQFNHTDSKDTQPPAVTDAGDDVTDVEGECFIELTDCGIYDRRGGYTRADVVEWHNGVAYEDDDVLVLWSAGHHHEWTTEFQLNVSAQQFDAWLMGVARDHFDRDDNDGHDPYATYQPVVYDKQTF